MATGYSPKIVTDGLILCLDAGNPKSYPGSGTTWKDLSGNGNNGTLTNGPTFDSGNGGSIVLDGTNQYVSIPDNTQLRLSPSHTIEYVMNMDTILGSFRATVMKQSFGTSYGHLINPTNAKMLIYLDSDTGVEHTSTATFSTGTWYHVVSTFSGGTSTFYVNGEEDSSVSGRTLTTNTNPLYIGTNATSNYFVDGRIPLVKLYTKALTASEIQKNYNALKGRYRL